MDVIEEHYFILKTMTDEMHNESPGSEDMYNPLMNYFRLMDEGMKQNYPIVWHFLTVSQEPLRAMDVTVISPEYLAGVMAILGTAEKYIDLPIDSLHEHMCVLNRFPVGLAISGDTVMPDMVIYGPNPCDAGLTTYSNLEHRFRDIPFYCADIPTKANDRGIKYMSGQLKEMVRSVENNLNIRMDLDRLRELIERSNQAFAIQKKLLDFQKLTPCPTPSFYHIMHGYANFGLPGVPEVLSWYERQYDWMTKRIEAGENAVPKENLRLAWIANNIDFDLGIYDWLEDEYGVVSVVCAMSLLDTDSIDTKDEDTIFEGLAKRTLHYPMPRNGRAVADEYIERSIAIAEEYKADAIVFAANTGCKYHWATAQLVRDAIMDRTGLPVLSFECSPWDERVLSTNGIKEKFTRFLDTIL